VGHVQEANKALKAGDRSGFVVAIKKLGSKAWAVAEGSDSRTLITSPATGSGSLRPAEPNSLAGPLVDRP
jgi:hypothetical protein